MWMRQPADRPSRCEFGGSSRAAIPAESPEGHFGALDLEPRVVRRVQARSFSDDARDVLHQAARPTDEMVVVVADSRLESRSGTGGLDPAHQPCGREVAQDLVHGRRRERGMAGTQRHRDRVRRRMRQPIDGVKYRDSRGRHAETSSPHSPPDRLSIHPMILSSMTRSYESFTKDLHHRRGRRPRFCVPALLCVPWPGAG